MPHLFRNGLAALAFWLLAAPASAAPSQPVSAQVQVTHLSSEVWQVDYQFGQPITALRLDKVGNYRRVAWQIQTPGVTLRQDGDYELLAASGRPLRRLRLQISTYGEVDPKAYAPFGVFSDGGRAVFLGHLHGEALLGRQARPLSTQIRLQGLPGEQVLTPPRNPRDPGAERGYAYFGPLTPSVSGPAHVIVDPMLPPAYRETLLRATAALAQHYQDTYGSPLKEPLVVLASVSGFSTPGVTFKGGATVGQLAYRFEVRGLLRNTPELMRVLEQLVAHEMAHLWQLNVTRGGVGDDDPWIHEGGAEAMSLEAVGRSGLWTAAQVQAYRERQIELCHRLQGAVDSYDGIYACGLMRFDQTGVPASTLWRSLISQADSQGLVFTPESVERSAARLKTESRSSGD